jgi:hypothetical protein
VNYLALVNAVREKCGVSGAALSTVAGQSGESLKIVNYVNDAYMDIQGMYENWQFMLADFTFPTVSHQQSYTPAQAGTTNFGNWKRDTFRIYQTSLGFSNEYYMGCQDYDEFRNLYQFGAQRTNYQRPVLFSIDPAKNLLLGPSPNTTGYTVVGKYWTVPTEMAASADIPVLPTEYHRAIVFRTMMFYGAAEAASEVYGQGEEEFGKILQRLELNQLPQIDLGGPML